MGFVAPDWNLYRRAGAAARRNAAAGGHPAPHNPGWRLGGSVKGPECKEGSDPLGTSAQLQRAAPRWDWACTPQYSQSLRSHRGRAVSNESRCLVWYIVHIRSPAITSDLGSATGKKCWHLNLVTTRRWPVPPCNGGSLGEGQRGDAARQVYGPPQNVRPLGSWQYWGSLKCRIFGERFCTAQPLFILSLGHDPQGKMSHWETSVSPGFWPERVSFRDCIFVSKISIICHMTPYNHSPHQNPGLMITLCIWTAYRKYYFPQNVY